MGSLLTTLYVIRDAELKYRVQARTTAHTKRRYRKMQGFYVYSIHSAGEPAHMPHTHSNQASAFKRSGQMHYPMI